MLYTMRHLRKKCLRSSTLCYLPTQIMTTQLLISVYKMLLYQSHGERQCHVFTEPGMHQRSHACEYCILLHYLCNSSILLSFTRLMSCVITR
jgi:hypothetical protein